MSQDIATKIKGLCDEKKISINKLLLTLNINTSFITDLSKGRMPAVDKIVKIATYFNVSTDYLLGIENTNEKGLGELDNEKKKVRRFYGAPCAKQIEALRKENEYSVKKMNELRVDISFLSNIEAKAVADFFQDPDFYANYYSSRGKPFLDEYEYSRTDLAYRIECRREEKGLSQLELADKIDVDELSVTSWESGERLPKQRCLEKLNAVLGLGEDMLRLYDKRFKSDSKPFPLSKIGSKE